MLYFLNKLWCQISHDEDDDDDDVAQDGIQLDTLAVYDFTETHM